MTIGITRTFPTTAFLSAERVSGLDQRSVQRLQVQKQLTTRTPAVKQAPHERFELPTPRAEIWCSSAELMR